MLELKGWKCPAGPDYNRNTVSIGELGKVKRWLQGVCERMGSCRSRLLDDLFQEVCGFVLSVTVGSDDDLDDESRCDNEYRAEHVNPYG